MTLQEMDLWNSGYRPSLGTGIAVALTGLITTAMIALGRAQGTLNMADVAGWLVAASGVMFTIVGMARDS